eukprot:Awhi_evm1s2761
MIMKFSDSDVWFCEELAIILVVEFTNSSAILMYCTCFRPYNWHNSASSDTKQNFFVNTFYNIPCSLDLDVWFCEELVKKQNSSGGIYNLSLLLPHLCIARASNLKI